MIRMAAHVKALFQFLFPFLLHFPLTSIDYCPASWHCKGKPAAVNMHTEAMTTSHGEFWVMQSSTVIKLHAKMRNCPDVIFIANG